VFTNLLSNAVKYSPERGAIFVKGWCQDGMACVSVADQGVGIGEEDMPHIFDRFFRAKTSAGIAGTGIGLNIVKLFVEGHGGEIKVESEKDKGSIFTVFLPISGPEQKGSAQTVA
jgi:signal transduction histidine kinase